MGRLYDVRGYDSNGNQSSVTYMLYDGDALVAEYDASGTCSHAICTDLLPGSTIRW